MGDVNIDVPEETLLALKLDRSSIAGELRLSAAVKLFEPGRLSSGAAATLAGVPKPAVRAKLAEDGVDTFTYYEEELREDLQHA